MIASVTEGDKWYVDESFCPERLMSWHTKGESQCSIRCHKWTVNLAWQQIYKFSSKIAELRDIFYWKNNVCVYIYMCIYIYTHIYNSITFLYRRNSHIVNQLYFNKVNCLMRSFLFYNNPHLAKIKGKRCQHP